MIVYEATKQLFVEDVVQDRIEENIDRKFYEKMGYHTSQSERKAWNNSMQYMIFLLNELIEHIKYCRTIGIFKIL